MSGQKKIMQIYINEMDLYINLYCYTVSLHYTFVCLCLCDPFRCKEGSAGKNWGNFDNMGCESYLKSLQCLGQSC